MSLEALYTRFVLVVPYLDESVVRTGYDVRFVPSIVVVDTINSLLMSLECKVGASRSELPYLHCSIEGRRCESIVILRVYYDLHYVVCVAFKDLLARPVAVPVPQLDGHIVT